VVRQTLIRTAGARNMQLGARRPRDSAARSPPTCILRTPPFFVGVTAQTHLVVLMGFRVFPIIPIVQMEATHPRFGHVQILLPLNGLGKVHSPG
jgi:hypothetical protein